MATSTASTTTLTRSTAVKPSRRPVMVGLGVCVAVLAVAGGIVAGQRLTTGPTTVAPVAPGTTVSFPSDWQLYRAGERGDVPPAGLPSDWTNYRSGER